MRAKSLVQNIRPAAVKSFLLINLGLILVALGIVLFNTPNNINLGGVSGLSILAAHLLPGLDVATFMLLINVFLIIIGLLLLGKDFGIKTILSTLALSGYVSLFTALIPLRAPLTNDMMLATNTACYDSVALYEDNAYVMTKVREACHNILYTGINSAAMNGIDQNTRIERITPLWQYWLITLDVVMGVVFVGGIALTTYLCFFRKKKEKQAK